MRLSWNGTECIIPKDDWCSIIAQLSYYGEEDYGWYRAHLFHDKVPLDRSSTIIDKPVPEGF